MASRKLEITVSSAQNLKNVNRRYGPLRSYAVLWVDGSCKCSTRKCCTRVDDNGDTSLVWNETVVIPLPPGPVEDQTLYIDVVHVRSDSEEDTKPVIGSAKLKLRNVIEEAGYGKRLLCSLHLKLPSGKPHGKLKVKVAVKEPAYGRPSYGQNQNAKAGKSKSRLRMWTSLAVGAVAEVLAGLALADGFDAVEDDIGYDNNEYDHDEEYDDNEYDDDEKYDDEEYDDDDEYDDGKEYDDNDEYDDGKKYSDEEYDDDDEFDNNEYDDDNDDEYDDGKKYSDEEYDDDDEFDNNEYDDDKEYDDDDEFDNKYDDNKEYDDDKYDNNDE